MPSSDAHNPVLELKGNLLTLMVLYLYEQDPLQIERHFAEKIAPAKNLFKNAPVVIDLHALQGKGTSLDLPSLLSLLRQNGLIPVGIRGGDSEQQEMALRSSLGILPDTKPLAGKTEPQEETALGKTKDKVVSAPVRSGQQLAALQGDLVVLSSVNPGGEVLAGKSIYIYGALRGRAVAGIHGYSEARIVCRNFDAELISIAGQYQLNEDFDRSLKGKAVQIYLENDRLKIQPFEG
jgi:septum site-determining protein MinC